MPDILHYANLTNGVICAPEGSAFTRIPSTWCEQKLWSKVLYGVGPDILAVAAAGRTVVVHDQSERQRQTRAQWQGLSWIRYACSVAWGLEEPEECSRNGWDVTPYWRRMYASLDKSDRAWLEYYRPAVRAEFVNINPCWCPREEWTHGDGKSLLEGVV